MKNKQAKINYADIWGLREEKYKFLEENDLKSTKWQELQPVTPYYFFVPKDLRGEKIYVQFISLKEIFSKYNAGVATGKDDVLVDFDKRSLVRKLSFHDKDTFGLTMQSYKVSNDLIGEWFSELNNRDINDQIIFYNYRPFDSRFTIYNFKILQRARQNLMNNLLKDNLAMCITNISNQKLYNEVFVTNEITDKHLTGHQTYVFPLYLYNREEERQQTAFDGQEKLDLEGVQHTLRHKSDKEPNIDSKLLDILRNTFSKILNPQEVFYYIYAILYSNIYRLKYQEFLKIDFPRIPFTKDYNLFKQLAELGEQLVNLHLLKTSQLSNPISKFHGGNGNRVEKREYEEKEKRVYINNQQYFENIDPEVWNYFIGGYQVLDKWLKDRKGRMLSSEDIKHYCKVVTVLSKTIETQKRIDKLYPEAEKNLIK